MQETMTNPELTNLDLSKIAALQQKRTLAFVNHFVVTTVQFLNSFMKQCEQSLMHFERKLEKVEAAVVLLETRLSSIPEVNKETAAPQPSEEIQDHAPLADTEERTDKKQQVVEAAKPEVQTYPEYNKFVKMVQVGVPLNAVKLKLTVEGLDATVLDKILHK